MSTRANIIIKDAYSTLYFYRHSDGYPESTGADLKEFCKGYQKNFRVSAMQSSGWLILHGAGPSQDGINDRVNKFYDWKVGDYEPTDSIHGDIEYLYVIDLDAMILETRVPTKAFYSDDSKCSLKNTKVIESYSISEKPGVIAKRGAK